MVLVVSNGNAKTKSAFVVPQNLVKFQKRIISLFTIHSFAIKMQKGNDNYAFVTAYYSNFGELITLMCPTNSPSAAVHICYAVVLYHFQSKNTVVFPSTSFRSVEVMFSFIQEIHSIRSIRDSLPFATKRINFFLFCSYVKSSKKRLNFSFFIRHKNVAIWSFCILICCRLVSIVVCFSLNAFCISICHICKQNYKNYHAAIVVFSSDHKRPLFISSRLSYCDTH